MLQDNVTLPVGGQGELDPFTDSIEVEYGGYDFTDSRPHQLINTQPHPLDQMQQILEESGGTWETSNTGQTGFDTGYSEDTDFAYMYTDDYRPSEMADQHGLWDAGNPAYGTGGTDLAYLDDRVAGTSDYTRGYIPPPTYESAMDGSDGGVSSGRSHDTEQAGGGEKGGYWLRQRH